MFINSQVLPAGVPVYSTAADEEDDPELIPASEDEEEEMTEGERRRHRHKFMIDYSTKISKWQEKSISADDIRFQLFLRGIELTDKQEQEMLRLKVRGDGKNPTRKDYLIGIVDDLIKSGKWTDEINDQLLLKRASDWHVKKHIGKGKENEEEEELPALEQQVVFTTEFDPDKVLNDGNINYRGLMFQLHVRDLLTPETIELLNKIPTDQKKKQYLVSLIEGLKENDEWNADFNSEKLSRKIKEFRKIRQQVKSKVVEPTAGSSSSSSGGIGSAIASGAKAVGGAVLEAGKEAVKEAVVAGARSAVMSLI